MSQPLNRSCDHEVLGELDTEAGEFWESSPFDLPNKGENLSAYEQNRLYMNRHGKGFVDASFASQADIDSDSRSVITSDFNGDSVPDLLVGNVGGGPLRLFINQLEQGNRIQIDLVGTKSNRTGIGSRIVAEIGDQRITRDVFQENGCMGSGPVQLSIGVGSAKTIDRLSVRWPSGKTQELKDVKVGARLTIREDSE